MDTRASSSTNMFALSTEIENTNIELIYEQLFINELGTKSLQRIDLGVLMNGAIGANESIKKEADCYETYDKKVKQLLDHLTKSYKGPLIPVVLWPQAKELPSIGTSQFSAFSRVTKAPTLIEQTNTPAEDVNAGLRME